MTVQDYRELARRAAGRAGPGYLKVFLIYTGILAVLNLLVYLLEAPLADWLQTSMQYLNAGNLELPQPSGRLLGSMALALALMLLGKTVTAAWVALSVRASRGEEYSWHDLSGSLSVLWKVMVISVIYYVGCLLASYLLIFPAVLLFYNWRLSFYVLGEHPEYGPIQCMRQSRKLMRGERMNLFRLDLSCILAYALAVLAYFSTAGILSLWKVPSLSILYAVFYNKMVYWKEPEADAGEPPAQA